MKKYERAEHTIWMPRLEKVMGGEPELECWQIAERFGVSEVYAAQLRHRIFRKLRRMEAADRQRRN